jgi:AcrR family transcriptional regulator
MSRLSVAPSQRRRTGARQPPPGNRRARSLEAKTLRREHLLAAAQRLLRELPFDAITVAGVARQANLAKASAYTYFATREALFLALLARELMQWMDGLRHRLDGGAADAASLARHLAASLAQAPTLRALLARLHSTLETNVPAPDLLWFKRFLAQFLADGAALVERAVPALRGRGEQVLLVTHALLIGIGQLAEPAPKVAAVLRSDPELHARLRVEFEPMLRMVLETLLSAWCADAKKGRKA